ncbi:hypothetical protein CRG98_046351 [Punica granatum]|uniref:Reverse transcriptase Ty1/copia-type domain-containing protein n=1 Tax=Punica granatum TaxID=22663 RepID=A0A2I0HNE3_PUNGR|nr:hypothetical protein CRG98_046351 [Punica granatum]
MDSMSKNQVWDLVDPIEGIIPIGIKWVFKRKIGVDGKVETDKARLVVNDVVAHYDYEVWQMDVKTAFLNGYIEEDIFMDQPKGFESKDKSKVLKRFNMQDSKRGLLLVRHGIHLSKAMSPKTPEEREKMAQVPYASAIGSSMYAILCTRPNIAYAVSVTSKYQSNPGPNHLTVVKNILKYLRRTKDMVLVYGGVAEYIAASDVAKEAVWIRKFVIELGVVPSISSSVELYCDNTGAIAQAKELRSHQKSKHIERRYHIIREIIGRGDVAMQKVASTNNVVDPLTKATTQQQLKKHHEKIGLRCCTE